MVYQGFEPGLLAPKDWCVNLSRPRTNVCRMNLLSVVKAGSHHSQTSYSSQPSYFSESTPRRAEGRSPATGGNRPAPGFYFCSVPDISQVLPFSLFFLMLPSVLLFHHDVTKNRSWGLESGTLDQAGS